MSSGRTTSPPSPRRPAPPSLEADARVGELLAGLVELGVDEGALPAGPLAPRLFAVAALLAGATGLAAWPGIEDPEAALAEAALAILRLPG